MTPDEMAREIERLKAQGNAAQKRFEVAGETAALRGCELSEAMEKLEQAEAQLAEAQARIREMEAERSRLIHTAQLFQPSGSPPCGDFQMLLRWILDTQQAKLAEARRKEAYPKAEEIAEMIQTFADNREADFVDQQERACRAEAQLAEAQAEADQRVALAGQQALQVFREKRAIGSYTPGLHEALYTLAREASEQEAREAKLREALERVLIEAGMQAHKHGCPSRLVRPAQWNKYAPCAGCEGEAALAASPEPAPPKEKP